MKLEDILDDPHKAYEAGRDLSDDVFEKIAEQIIESVAQNAYSSCYAGLDWNDERFNKHAEQIIQTISQDAQNSYYAGEHWSKERFDRAAIRIAYKVSQDPVLQKRAETTWRPERYKIVEIFNIATNNEERDRIANLLQQVGLQYNQTMHVFTFYIRNKLARMTPSEFLLATEAHSFAEQVEQEEPFFNGLEESIDKGTVDKWAKHIIQYFRENSKGAGNYRILEVAA